VVTPLGEGSSPAWEMLTLEFVAQQEPRSASLLRVGRLKASVLAVRERIQLRKGDRHLRPGAELSSGLRPLR
jgi:hypothetical protein